MDANRFKIGNAMVMLGLGVAFLLALITEPAYAQVVRITVNMTGAQEVPPVMTAGTGTAKLNINTTTRSIRGSVNFTGLSSPSAAGHIHIGAVGVNGRVIIPLIGGVGVTSGGMRVPPGTVLLPAQLKALRNNRLYINIHTSNNPGGEIRGQIRFPRAAPEASVKQGPMLKVVSPTFGLMWTGDELARLGG